MAVKGFKMTQEHKDKISAAKKGMVITWKCTRPFEKGHTPWNKGISKKFNNKLDEWRENGGEVWNKGLTGEANPNFGKKRSDEFRKKMSELAKKRVLDGTHNLWKGGVREKNSTERRIIMDSFEYKEWRRMVFTRDNHTCQICMDKSIAGNRVKLNADHIKPFIDFPELRFDVSNGRTLCEKCHRKTDTYGSWRKKKY